MSFTPFQRLVAQVTLEAIADLGFALGGGQALHAHGYGDRLSLDLDFYVTKFDQDLFDRAEAATLAALRGRGYIVEVGHSDTWLRQIIVTDAATGEQVVIDLGQDYRQHPPLVITGLGPVIDLPDAAASKARALNDRRAARDYLDIHALLTQTGWTPAQLFAALRDNLDPSSPLASSPQTSPPPATRIPRTTTPTVCPTPTSPASPLPSPPGHQNYAAPRHSEARSGTGSSALTATRTGSGQRPA